MIYCIVYVFIFVVKYLFCFPFCRMRPCVQSERTEADYMSYLVPMEIALRHVAVLTLLGSIHHTE